MNGHAHQSDKEVLLRMSKIIGHATSVKKMIEDHRDCSDILIQIAAVKSALNNVGKILLKDHISNCLVEALELNEDSRTEAICNLNDAIDIFVK